MKKPQQIYEWIANTGASQLQASEHFGCNQSYISRAVRSYAQSIGKKAPDNRRKG